MITACHQDRRQRAIATGKRIIADVARKEIFDFLSKGRWGAIFDRMRGLSGFVPRFARQYQIFGANGACRILAPDVKRFAQMGREPSSDIAFNDELSWGSPIERVSALCLRGYTQNQLLRDIDAVSMAHSLEVRVPYLDPLIVDVALSLPDSVKVGDMARVLSYAKATYRETGTKRILIDSGRDLLPEGMDLQQKRGFGMPFDSWLRGPIREVMDDTLSPVSVSRRGYFNAAEVESVRDDFLSGKRSWVYPWLLITTELWCREVLDTGPPRQINRNAD